MDLRLWRAAFSVALLCGTWVLLSPAPPQTGAEGLPGFDKIAHVALLGLLAFLARMSFPLRAPAEAFIGLVLYATAIEIVQPVFGRAPEVLDLIAGALGAAVAFVVNRRRRDVPRV